MAEQIKIGATFTWTLQSPKESGKDNTDFYSFIKDYMPMIGENSQISGSVIYVCNNSAIIKINEMTKDLFPFTLFHNEVKNRFFDFEVENIDPYQKYFCMDMDSMVSLFYYDLNDGFLVDAVFDEDGNFEDYDFADVNEEMDFDIEMSEGFLPDQINVLLPEEDIESYESQGVLSSSEDIQKTDENGNLLVPEEGFSVKRASYWSDICDCAMLTAWRSDKTRKQKDEDNRNLQRKLRELGYGVSKITGWFAEKDKEVSRENSFFVVNKQKDEAFRNNIYKLSELYEQDSFLYKKAGKDNPAILIHTNDNTGKGTEKLLGRLRIGNMDAKIYSQIRAGRITFE